MANNQGPWGGGGNSGNGGGDKRPPEGPGRRPDDVPDIDELMAKGRDQLRVLMGGKGGSGGPGRPGGGKPGGSGPELSRGVIGLGVLGALALWAMASFYTVKPEEQSVELMLGKYSQTGQPGLNFAPWPVVTREVIPVTTERTIDIGTSRSGLDAGLMLTGDENIVDIDFQVVWNITDPAQYLFNLADPKATIEAVAESAMREIIAQSDLAPILNRDRGAISDRLTEMIQLTLDSYNSGVNIVRVNFDKADPPEPVIAAFRMVQDAEQERDRLRNVADAYSNQKVAEARGQAAEILEQAEAYRARVVNEAEGEASRFAAVLEEYAKAPDVTRRRLYLETMEAVFGNMDMIVMEDGSTDGAVPYLPLDRLTRGAAEGGNN